MIDKPPGIKRPIKYLDDLLFPIWIVLDEFAFFRQFPRGIISQLESFSHNVIRQSAVYKLANPSPKLVSLKIHNQAVSVCCYPS